jgi:predicted exporter
MRTWAAAIWLAVVALAVSYLAVRIHHGLPLRTDLLALLPSEDQDPAVQRATDAVSRELARRIVILVGHASRARARDAAVRLAADLSATGLLSPATEALHPDRLKRLGSLYLPYRQGLLAQADRALLAAGHGDEVADKAMAQVFSVGGLADGNLLRIDPFLLLPSFFAALPIPLSRLKLDDGMLTVNDDQMIWVAVVGSLVGEPFALDVQERLVRAFDASAAALHDATPGIQIKRLGAVFFAEAGSRTAIGEASTISTISIIGTVLLIIGVFRRIRPLLHNLLVVGIGIVAALAGSLIWFGELHVAALLFGTSLIGVAFDYGLYYSSSVFDPAGGTPRDRLRRIMPGITLGALTTMLGYGALALAPFPGLRQIAVFSVVGLLAAFATVVLVLPTLDRKQSVAHAPLLLGAVNWGHAFWAGQRWRRARVLLVVAAAVVAFVGLARFRADNDVRHMQALSPELVREQEEIQHLIGTTVATQFLLIEAGNDETALRREEEIIAPVLARLEAGGTIAGAQMPAAFVPSAARQSDNRALVHAALEQPYLARQRAILGMESEVVAATAGNNTLTLAEALASGAVPMLRELVLGPGLHVVTLQGLTDPGAVRSAVAGVTGVRFIDPTADFSILLDKYQQRALLLTALSALLMFVGLARRYGWRGSAWVMLPPVVAVSLGSAMLILIGQTFNFFHAMALVLLLSVTSDYAIFCAESPAYQRQVTLLAVSLAALTTLLSFGLLAVSRVPAVFSFGSTMLVGILLAFFLAPLATRGNRSLGAQLARAAPNSSDLGRPLR